MTTFLDSQTTRQRFARQLDVSVSITGVWHEDEDENKKVSRYAEIEEIEIRIKDPAEIETDQLGGGLES